MVNRVMVPKDVQVLIPGTCEFATLYCKRDFTGMIKLRVFRWGTYPGLSVWAQRHHKDPHERKAGE